ncbi:hypothetical protein S101258_01805 [Lactiplantibacillus plantarum subsp. plantarum]|uniref:Uncharacterized protein n=1 Tax=Lactiplantibacillus plantarum subsp. plantarum TaxID=337330 RepID=A0A2S3U593_LACPN|nr:hypothetical protein S101258_01805 [Lactiplantibacillus plantarum subsp. plantarum]
MAVDAQLGTEAFEKVIFMLDVVPTANNIQEFALQGNLYPEPIDDETRGRWPGYYRMIITSSWYCAQRLKSLDSHLRTSQD